MEKISKFSLRKLIASIVINAVVLIASVLVFVPFFEEIDDVHVAMIAEGAYGTPEWHLIYPNFILGKLYVLLQSIAPMIRWHVILQYVFIYVGYVLLIYILFKHKRGKYMVVPAILSTFYELYVSIQYTKTAAFVCSVGMLLIFEYVRNKAKVNLARKEILTFDAKGTSIEDVMYLTAALVLIVYGTLLRPESFFIAAVPISAVGIVELLRTKEFIRYMCVFVPVLLAVFLLSFFNSYVYSKESNWASFMSYNKARMQLNDYRYDILDFTKYEAKLAELNVSENDALAILTYQFGDDNVLSYERMKEIRDAFPSKSVSYELFANLFEHLVNEFLTHYLIFVGALGLGMAYIVAIITDRSKSNPGFITDSRRKVLGLVIMIATCGAAIFYFEYSGRFSHRLMASVLIPTVFAICYITDSLPIRENESKIVFGGNRSDKTLLLSVAFSVMSVIACMLLYIGNVRDYNEYLLIDGVIYEDLIGILDDNEEECLYIADTFTFQNAFKYRTFYSEQRCAFDSFVTCGSWFVNSPITKTITQRYGYDNPYDALRSGNDKVVLLDNSGLDCKLLFLKEHYGKVYEAVPLENTRKINVYAIREKDN